MNKIECHDIHIPLFIKKEYGLTEKNVPLILQSFKLQKEGDNTKVLGLEFLINPNLSFFPLFSKEGQLVLIFYDKSLEFKDAYDFYFNIEQGENEEKDTD